ncbi:MAG TPA: heme-binding domain-containing protein [Chitinophagaceae bacterium]|nr:heme-binding domain-containing protein [Chitinophagaceae bacterium]
MKKVFKTIGWLLLIALVVIQFFRPEKNLQKGISTTHFSTKYPVPDDVNLILNKACYDCHSNNSRYPWYFNIQPIGIWMDDHIREAKNELNFSEYTNKRLQYQYHKMEEVIEVLDEGAMPIDSYTWTHKDAILTPEEKSKLKNWAQSIMDTLEAQYPIDSLKRPAPPPPQK